EARSGSNDGGLLLLHRYARTNEDTVEVHYDVDRRPFLADCLGAEAPHEGVVASAKRPVLQFVDPVTTNAAQAMTWRTAALRSFFGWQHAFGAAERAVHHALVRSVSVDLVAPLIATNEHRLPSLGALVQSQRQCPVEPELGAGLQ